MKMMFAVTVAVLSLVALCNMAYAETAFEMSGSGAAVTNDNNPKMYQSVLRITLSDPSTITRGSFLVYGNDIFLHAYVLPQRWSFSYDTDGSFHGQGIVQTSQGQSFNMTLDGNRVFRSEE